VTQIAQILIVSSNQGKGELLVGALKEENYSVSLATNSSEAFRKIKEKGFDVVIADLKPPCVNGRKIVKGVGRISPRPIVILLGQLIDIETMLELLQEGAYDYLKKPFVVDELKILIRRALREKGYIEEDGIFEQRLGGQKRIGPLIGKSLIMQKVFSQIEDVAKTSITVLIQGATGTGKELVASAIHNFSHRKNGPFLSINCGALPESLLESELFGHEKGAFTDAVNTKLGLFSAAGRGTLFLDEISEASPNVQVKLLRVAEHKQFLRVGGTKPIKVDVRLIAATNKDLKKCVKEGKFRKDLYYRLNVFSILTSPLRERREDIPLFLKYFLKENNRFLHKNIKGISDEALDLLLNYEWPGNIRELENALLQAITICKNSIITASDLPVALHSGGSPSSEMVLLTNLPFKESKRQVVESFERRYLKNLLYKCQGNVSSAARVAQVARPFFYEKIRKYEMDASDFRAH